MADDDDWTADDDAQLRAALTSLRAEVEAAPLPDVRFVKARGMARRRQRLLSWTAAAAAAAVVVGTVGYSQFGREATLQTPPAAQSSTTSAAPSPTTTSSLDQPGAMPLLTEWTSSLALTGTVRRTPVKPFGPVECLSAEPGTKVQQEEITRAPEFQGGQTRFAIGTGQEVETAAQQVAQEIASCQVGPGYKVTEQSAGQTWPRLFTFTAGDAGSGWWAVVPGLHDVVVLHINQNDRPTSAFTSEQVSGLADIATKRLAQYGSGSTTTSSPTGTGGSGPKAINEKMPVTGPAPVPSSELFVAASQWTDPLFAKGAKASAGAGDTADSMGDIGVFCETDDFLSGFGGALGEVEVRAGPGDANVIGHQRVRVDESDTSTPEGAALAKTTVNAQLAEEKALLVMGCTESDGKVTATQGPTDGTYLLTKMVTGEATGVDYRWVGVTALSTPGAWTTIVFHGTGDGQGFQGSATEGFAQLDRLLALARQK